MKNNTAEIIQINDPINESAEFKAFARRTDDRLRGEYERAEVELRNKNLCQRKKREARKKLLQDCKLFFCGVIATICCITAILAWDAAYHALAIFPAVLALLAINQVFRGK